MILLALCVSVFPLCVETKKTSSVVIGVIVGAAILAIAGLALIGFYLIRSRRRSLEGK